MSKCWLLDPEQPQVLNTAHMTAGRCLYIRFSEEALGDARGILQVSQLLLLSISRPQRVVIGVRMLHPPPGDPLITSHTQPVQDSHNTLASHKASAERNAPIMSGKHRAEEQEPQKIRRESADVSTEMLHSALFGRHAGLLRADGAGTQRSKVSCLEQEVCLLIERCPLVAIGSHTHTKNKELHNNGLGTSAWRHRRFTPIGEKVACSPCVRVLCTSSNQT